jgi:hypothetical protein
MKITAEVTIRARLADGTEMDVTRTAVLQHGDNPLYAPDGAQKAVDTATESALRSFAAGMGHDVVDGLPVTALKDPAIR